MADESRFKTNCDPRWMIMGKLRLFFRLIEISFKSQMQHRASFLMLISTYFLSTSIDIIGIWVLFDRFKMVQGWTLKEVAILYGIMHIGFSIPEAFARGFDNFGLLIKNGDFDRILLRPLGTLFQMASREIQWLRLGRFLQGCIILTWGCLELQFSLSALHVLIIFLAILGTAAVFYALFILQATLTFWTIETMELMNIATFGGLEVGQYPISIYPPLLRGFFTFIIPLACVAYYPIATALNHETIPLWLGTIAPLSGLLFLSLSIQLWKLGVRHYNSTGS